MTNMLLDGLPDSVEICGRLECIETGYRTGIMFEKLLRRSGRTDAETLLDAIELYYPGADFQTHELEEAVDAMLWFYRCGRDTQPEEVDGCGTGEKSFDVDYDAPYIYAAFLQVYNIDLLKNDIHWWQYRALFDALPDDTRLVKIIGYRTAEVPKDASDERRQQIESMKRAYALPLDADQLQLKTDLEAILRHGGNPAALLEGGAGNNVIRRDP